MLTLSSLVWMFTSHLFIWKNSLSSTFLSSVVIASKNCHHAEQAVIHENIFCIVVCVRIPQTPWRHLDSLSSLFPNDHLHNNLISVKPCILHFALNAVRQWTGQLWDLLRVIPHSRQLLPNSFPNTLLHDGWLKLVLVIRSYEVCVWPLHRMSIM